MIRILNASYDDGYSLPYGGYPSRLPSTRDISNTFFGRYKSGERNITSKLITVFFAYWGEFISRDLIYTADGIGPCESFPIPIPNGDDFYDPKNLTNLTMNFCRTPPINGTGTNITNIREYANYATPWIDASHIYGVNQTWANALRTFKNGLMKTYFTKGPDGEIGRASCRERV